MSEGAATRPAGERGRKPTVNDHFRAADRYGRVAFWLIMMCPAILLMKLLLVLICPQ